MTGVQTCALPIFTFGAVSGVLWINHRTKLAKPITARITNRCFSFILKYISDCTPWNNLTVKILKIFYILRL